MPTISAVVRWCGPGSEKRWLVGWLVAPPSERAPPAGPRSGVTGTCESADLAGILADAFDPAAIHPPHREPRGPQLTAPPDGGDREVCMEKRAVGGGASNNHRAKLLKL